MNNTTEDLNRLIEDFNSVITDIKAKRQSGFFNDCDVNYACAVIQPYIDQLLTAYKNAF